MSKKFLALLIVLSMVLCACTPILEEPIIKETAEPVEAAATPEPQPVLDRDLVILYTNDVHCAVDDNLGYAALSAYKKALEEDGNYVALVDAGDSLQGAPIGTLSKGSYIIDIMNQVGYDVAIPGNHEFDYGMERFFELRDAAAFPYVSCNFVELGTGEPVLEPYTILTFHDVKVAFVGISTPKTITSSTPAYFQDGQGNFIYGFCQDETGSALYSTVQAAVDNARADGAQYVIALSHLGIEAECSPWTSSEVIANTTGIDAVLDGHSHSTIESERMKNALGEWVTLSSTGTKLSAVGMLLLTKEGNLSTGLVTSLPEADPDTGAFIADIKARYEELLNQVVATSEVDLVINQPGTDPAVRIVRSAETNLGDLCADAYRAMSGADIAIVNGGGVRAEIMAGDVTFGDILNVHPFGNALCMVEATGQEILNALEVGARAIPSENGGFLQVSGLTYEIHTYIPSSVQMDENSMFVSVNGEYRVKNVMVNGEPLDLAKVYTLASHNYLFFGMGDGYTMFADNTVLLDSVMLDNQVLINYIVDQLGGVIGGDYADPFGQGRIVAVESAS